MTLLRFKDGRITGLVLGKGKWGCYGEFRRGLRVVGVGVKCSGLSGDFYEFLIGYSLGFLWVYLGFLGLEVFEENNWVIYWASGEL